MFISRGAAKILVALVLVAFATQGVRADQVTINDGPWGEYPLFRLFNEYFGTDYQDSQAIFNDLGVVSKDWIALPDAKVYGAFKIAALDHELNFVYTNGAEVTPIYLRGDTVSGTIDTGVLGGDPIPIPEGTFSMFLNTLFSGVTVGTVDTYGATYQQSGSSVQNDMLIHMIALDVTDLMSEKLGYEIQSAYMFCWEDLPDFVPQGGAKADWDFQDLFYILVNVRDGTSLKEVTPEPATALILLAGLAACPLARRLRKK